jgi:hypothetical protein
MAKMPVTKAKPPALRSRRALRWVERLGRKVQQVLVASPGADPNNVRDTLILLEQGPLERLERNLLRGDPATNRR